MQATPVIVVRIALVYLDLIELGNAHPAMRHVQASQHSAFSSQFAKSARGESLRSCHSSFISTKANRRMDSVFQFSVDQKAEVAANCDHLANGRFSKALRLLRAPPDPPKRPIGFVTPPDLIQP
jgi:hypothetical protein